MKVTPSELKRHAPSRDQLAQTLEVTAMAHDSG
jgi:hypothetical protein